MIYVVYYCKAFEEIDQQTLAWCKMIWLGKKGKPMKDYIQFFMLDVKISVFDNMYPLYNYTPILKPMVI